MIFLNNSLLLYSLLDTSGILQKFHTSLEILRSPILAKGSATRETAY